MHRAGQPLAVAVSGGGDSIALLHLVADWAGRRDRRLIVLSVDHGLSPDAAGWNARVRAIANTLGAQWRGLVWTGHKPPTGLVATARRARHALIAEAARAAGARVVLMGHTADDVAEADWMRDQGTPLGRVQDWSPSPVWPEGRGLMLMRPLLDVSRQDLRAWMVGEGIGWIDDPANSDPRFLRSRARAAGPPRRPIPARSHPPLDLQVEAKSGVVTGPVTTPWLAQALACASGREVIPSGVAVARLRQRLSDDAHSSVLSGARVRVEGNDLIVTRELGRSPPPDQELSTGIVQIWDGRFALLASQPGWRVGLAAGRRSALSSAERAILGRLPAEARAAHPVLFRERETRPILADQTVEVTCLVASRLDLAVGQAQTEDDL